MTKHTVIETPGGERLVLVPIADYEALVARLGEADEDAADIVAYEAAKVAVAEGEPRVLGRAVLEGYKIRAIRKKANLTQEALAQRLEVSQGFISDVESGRRSFTPRMMEALEEIEQAREPE